jgi:hypothetical protein
MANNFDSEVDRLKAAPTGDRHQDMASASQRLESLLKEIEASRHADQSKIGAEIGDDGLSVSVNRQAVGLWRVEGPDLALYRPGSAAADCHVSSIADAAKMTARLVAAAGQA